MKENEMPERFVEIRMDMNSNYSLGGLRMIPCEEGKFRIGKIRFSLQQQIIFDVDGKEGWITVEIA